MTKNKQNAARHVDADELRELGFPEDLIQEALLREQRGLLAIEPPPDLVERTIEACADLFRTETPSRLQASESDSTSYFSIVFHLLPAVKDLTLAFQGAATVTQCQRLGEWAGRLAAPSVRFALTERQRPLVALESHMLTSPSWWEDNPEFQEMKAAFHTLNEFVASTGIARSARIVILRQNISEYNQDEIGAIEALTREGTSDLWWIAFSNAASYSRENIVVMGNESVLRLRGKVKSASEALEAMEYSQDAELANELRQKITKEICSHAVPVKIGGQLEPFVVEALQKRQGIRTALRKVMESQSTEPKSNRRPRELAAQR